MSRFIVGPSQQGPFFTIVRTGNHGKPAGQIIAMRITSEAQALTIADALTVWEEAQEKLGINAKHLIDIQKASKDTTNAG